MDQTQLPYITAYNHWSGTLDQVPSKMVDIYNCMPWVVMVLVMWMEQSFWMRDGGATVEAENQRKIVIKGC